MGPGVLPGLPGGQISQGVLRAAGKALPDGRHLSPEHGIDATEIPPGDLDDYEHEGKPMVVAINYLSVKPGHEQAFEEQVEDLCMDTTDKEGFIGTMVVRATNISYGSSMLHGDYEDIEIQPAKYIM